MVWFGVIWCDVVVWCGVVVWFGVVWWYGGMVVWSGEVWCDMVIWFVDFGDKHTQINCIEEGQIPNTKYHNVCSVHPLPLFYPSLPSSSPLSPLSSLLISLLSSLLFPLSSLFSSLSSHSSLSLPSHAFLSTSPYSRGNHKYSPSPLSLLSLSSLSHLSPHSLLSTLSTLFSLLSTLISPHPTPLYSTPHNFLAVSQVRGCTNGIVIVVWNGMYVKQIGKFYGCEGQGPPPRTL